MCGCIFLRASHAASTWSETSSGCLWPQTRAGKATSLSTASVQVLKSAVLNSVAPFCHRNCPCLLEPSLHPKLCCIPRDRNHGIRPALVLVGTAPHRVITTVKNSIGWPRPQSKSRKGQSFLGRSQIQCLPYSSSDSALTWPHEGKGY